MRGAQQCWGPEAAAYRYNFKRIYNVFVCCSQRVVIRFFINVRAPPPGCRRVFTGAENENEHEWRRRCHYYPFYIRPSVVVGLFTFPPKLVA